MPRPGRRFAASSTMPRVEPYRAMVRWCLPWRATPLRSLARRSTISMACSGRSLRRRRGPIPSLPIGSPTAANWRGVCPPSIPRHRRSSSRDSRGARRYREGGISGHRSRSVINCSSSSRNGGRSVSMSSPPPMGRCSGRSRWPNSRRSGRSATGKAICAASVDCPRRSAMACLSARPAPARPSPSILPRGRSSGPTPIPSRQGATRCSFKTGCGSAVAMPSAGEW